MTSTLHLKSLAFTQSRCQLAVPRHARPGRSKVSWTPCQLADGRRSTDRPADDKVERARGRSARWQSSQPERRAEALDGSGTSAPASGRTARSTTVAWESTLPGRNCRQPTCQVRVETTTARVRSPHRGVAGQAHRTCQAGPESWPPGRGPHGLCPSRRAWSLLHREAEGAACEGHLPCRAGAETSRGSPVVRG